MVHTVLLYDIALVAKLINDIAKVHCACDACGQESQEAHYPNVRRSSIKQYSKYMAKITGP